MTAREREGFLEIASDGNKKSMMRQFLCVVAINICNRNGKR